mgnify:CR=1 FL=1
MNAKFERWRRISLISYFALLITVVVWYIVISPPQYILSTILTVTYVAILLAPVVYLIRKTPHVYAWSSFIMLIYISHAIIETWANDVHRYYAIAELISSSVYFVSATICAGYVKQAAKKSESNE